MQESACSFSFYENFKLLKNNTYHNQNGDLLNLLYPIPEIGWGLRCQFEIKRKLNLKKKVKTIIKFCCLEKE